MIPSKRDPSAHCLKIIGFTLRSLDAVFVCGHAQGKIIAKKLRCSQSRFWEAARARISDPRDAIVVMGELFRIPDALVANIPQECPRSRGTIVFGAPCVV